MEKEKYEQVVEWKIENFSCWCAEVHGKSIESPPFFFNSFHSVELYPSGVSGLDDRMRICFREVNKDFTTVLTFIGSNKSSIFSQRVTIRQKGQRVPGSSVDLKFEEVVAQIRKADQKDQLTLRFCNQNVKNYEQRICTTIDVLEVSFKYNPELIESFEPNEYVLMLFIPFSSEKDTEGISVRSSCENEIMKLAMRPNTTEKAFLVESFTYMLSSDNTSVKYEERKHVFLHGEAWTFSESIKPKELVEKGTILFLHLKIVNGLVIQRYNHLNYLKEVSIVPSKSRCICFSDLKLSKSPVTSNQSEDSSTVLKNDFMRLYQDQDFSDFTLKCGDVSFPVHRNILSARSPVFKSMLTSDMIEAASSTVDIENLDAQTLSRFLAFLYTGIVEEMECESALKLYYSADKYQVLSLKREVVDFLRENVSVSNVCDILTLADKHKDNDLIAASYDFILNNYNDVLGSKEWENLMEVEPFLAVKTVTHFAQKKYVKIDIPRS